MIWLIVFVLMIFRWPILERFIGTIRMFLFDAIMWTIWAAINFAQPQPYPVLSFAMGCLCLWWSISSGRKYLKYDAMRNAPDEQGKSDAGTTKGS